MNEIEFTCPHCGAALECDGSFAGQEMQCSSCQGLLVTPESPVAPPPAPMMHPGAGRPRSGSNVPGGKRKSSKKRKTISAGKVFKIAVGVVVAAVACYFGFGYAMKLQGHLNEERRKAEADSDGGQVGHIADLYAVLEATDPTNFEVTYQSAQRADMSYPPYEQQDAGAMGEPAAQALRDELMARMAEIQSLPVVAPTWRLEVDAARIPDGRANGNISGADFVAESAFISSVGESYVLSLRQGEGVNPDQELLVYLHLEPDEKPGGQMMTVSKNDQGGRVSQVIKRWKTNPKYTPRKKAFNTGYAMRLELGKSSLTGLSGKIYVALPDTEQTVVAGSFYAVVPQTTLAPGGGPDGGDY